MIKSKTNITTENARPIMRRLCKHWSHKLEVKLEDKSSHIQLPMGVCEFFCDEQQLKVELSAQTTDEMAQLQKVVADHLVRMAHKEEITINWQ